MVEQKDRREHIAVGHLLDGQQIPIQNALKAVAIGKFGWHLAFTDPK
jgi:hypothetical protein